MPRVIYVEEPAAKPVSKPVAAKPLPVQPADYKKILGLLEQAYRGEWYISARAWLGSRAATDPDRRPLIESLERAHREHLKHASWLADLIQQLGGKLKFPSTLFAEDVENAQVCTLEIAKANTVGLNVINETYGLLFNEAKKQHDAITHALATRIINEELRHIEALKRHLPQPEVVKKGGKR
jgi:bacterioferritin (cytochrome b1)